MQALGQQHGHEVTAGPNAAEERSVRELVDSCISNDDITPLLRLVFEAQALAPSTEAMDEEGQAVVSVLQRCLASVAAQQEAVIQEVCHGNASEIAECVGQMGQMQEAVEETRGVLSEGNGMLQAAGTALVEDARSLDVLLCVQRNIGEAAGALAAAQQVLEQCSAVGQLVEQQRLYQALCQLDRVQGEHLDPLLSLLARDEGPDASPHTGTLPNSANGYSNGSLSPPRPPRSAAQLHNAARLQAFFQGLLTDLQGAVLRSALSDFNDWLVLARAQARDIGMSAIRHAAVERQLDEDLARERKAALTAVLSGRSIQEFAAELVQLPFRQELAQEVAQLVAKQQQAAQRAAAASRAQPSASSSSAGSSSGGAGLLQDLDMRGLHRAVHVHRHLNRLDAFTDHYLEQRRLQIHTDLQPPLNFLENYQAYLARVTGFFVIEDHVQRIAQDLVQQQQVNMLWEAALSALKTTLDRALGGITSAHIALLVKDFVLLVCVALAQCNYTTIAVEEILLSSRLKYHELLMATAAEHIGKVMEGDVLQDYEIRTQAAFDEQIITLGLPERLEGATPLLNGTGSGGVGGGRATSNPAAPRPGAAQPPFAPFAAPYTPCIPALLQCVRTFVADSLSYLKGLYSPAELLPAVLYHRDRMITKVVVDALMVKVQVVNSHEMLRECMKMVSNVWSLIQALDALDDYTALQAKPDASRAAADAAEASRAPFTGGSATPGRARARRAATQGSVVSSVRAALRSVQDAAERNMLRWISGRTERLLDAARSGNWLPAAPLPQSPSVHVDTLLAYLQETLEHAQAALPRPSYQFLCRTVMKAIGTSLMRLFTPDGVKSYNMWAIGRLANDLAVIERFSARCNVASLTEELAEPRQLCQLLLSNQIADIMAPDLRRARYPALELATVALALDRYKEVPGQAKKQPELPSKKYMDGLAKQLRGQLVTGTGQRALEDL